MSKMEKITVFWFRRDLRLFDNCGLYHALQSGNKVLPLFIFDRNILDDLKDKRDARVNFIYNELLNINKELKKFNSGILIKYGYPQEIWKDLCQNYSISNVYCNEDFEPYGIKRDNDISAILDFKKIDFHLFLDHLIFRPDTILKDDDKPYTVFTPYSKKWLRRLDMEGISRDAGPLKEFESESMDNYYEFWADFPELKEIGFEKLDIEFPSKTVEQSKISMYDQTRNFPAINGTSKLGLHFRFGTVSVREKFFKAFKLNTTFVKEMIWREFYSQILFHFPRVVNESFRKEYDNIKWRDDEKDYKSWCDGKTGYELVDAGMRELNSTGFMHNRVRMVAASFLTKHLLIDWRWGEAYFAEKLLDFELASNNGGWQWAAGSGTDAAPYFRIFNPNIQLEKFDKNRAYVKKYVSEYGTESYPKPIVDHKFARERCLEVYKNALKPD